MDPAIAQLTQKLLGAFVKRPQLTEKLLSRPPFRFLHDLIMSFVQTTGLMKGLFTDAEMISENVSNRDSKIIFLAKVIEFVRFTSGGALSVNSMKIIAGQEPEKTNKLLQELAELASVMKPTNHDDIVRQVLARIASSSSKVASSTPNVKDDHVTNANRDKKVRNIDTPRPISIVNSISGTESPKQTGTQMLDSNKAVIGESKLSTQSHELTSSEKEKRQANSSVRLEKNDNSSESSTSKVLTSTSNASSPGLSNVAQTTSDSSDSAKVFTGIQSIRAAAANKLASSIAQVGELREGGSVGSKPVQDHHHSTNVVGKIRTATPIPTKSSSNQSLFSKDTIETLIEEPVENEEMKLPVTVEFNSLKSSQVTQNLESQVSLHSTTTVKKSQHKRPESSKTVVQRSEAAKSIEHSSSENRKRNKPRPKGSRNPIKPNETEKIKENRLHFEQPSTKQNNIHSGRCSGNNIKRNNSRSVSSFNENETLFVTRPKIILDRVMPSGEDDSDNDEDDRTLQIFNLSHLESSYSRGTSSVHSNDFSYDPISGEHGQLVKRMMETSRRGLEDLNSKVNTVSARTEEQSTLIRQRERQKATDDTDHLRLVLQGLTGDILELIKVMDIVQEHHHTIQKESYVWRKEARDNYTLLQLEEVMTEASIKPLVEQLQLLDREIEEQRDSNASVKVQILSNEGQLLRLIRGSSPE